MRGATRGILHVRGVLRIGCAPAVCRAPVLVSGATRGASNNINGTRPCRSPGCVLLVGATQRDAPVNVALVRGASGRINPDKMSLRFTT